MTETSSPSHHNSPSPHIAILGGGISGLASAFWIHEFLPQATLHLFDSQSEVGGKIHSEMDGDFLFEAGAHLLMIQRAATKELCTKLGLMDQLIYGSATSSIRYLLQNGKLMRVAESPWQFLKSNPLTLSGWWRLFQEPFISPHVSSNPEGDDESLQDFSVRRLGLEFTEKFINPMARGVLAGNPENISVQAAYPHLQNMEKKFGCLAKGYAKQVFAKKPLSNSSPLASFSKGHQTLTIALQHHLQKQGIQFHTQSSIQDLQYEKKFRIITSSTETNIPKEFDGVIASLPAPDLAAISKSLSKTLHRFASSIPYSSLVAASIGLNAEQAKKIPVGFGFLVPRREKSPILSGVFSSQIFSNRAPNSQALLNLSLGGAEYPSLIHESESALGKIIWSELQNIFGLSGEPSMLRIHKHLRAMPQYPVGHLKNVKNMEAYTLKALPGLYLAGSGYYGTGIENCLANAKKTAENISTYFLSR